MKSQDILSVLISVVIIIAVAVLQKQSKVIAALISTMPVRAGLAIWIVYAATNGNKEDVTQFSLSVAYSLIPTFLFAVSAWLAARAGMKLGGILFSGYTTWALVAGIIFLARKFLGLG